MATPGAAARANPAPASPMTSPKSSLESAGELGERLKGAMCSELRYATATLSQRSRPYHHDHCDRHPNHHPHHTTPITTQHDEGSEHSYGESMDA